MPQCKETNQLTGAKLVETMDSAEIKRAAVVESILPALQAAAADADSNGEFPAAHVSLLANSGLLGLIVPTAYGGMGGTLRDLAAATFAMGTACPSTALAYFFHCSTASRGLLGLEAIEAGLFDAEEALIVKAFAEKVLHKMGSEAKLLGNFASESAKSSKSSITISTTASKVAGGWRLSGTKFFGCNSGVADEYLVTAMLEGSDSAEGLAIFFVKRDAEGVSVRSAWDAIGMRATANNGIVLDNVIVASEDALAIPGAFVKMMQVSRGTFVGNQLAGTVIYLGAAQNAFDWTLDFLTKTKFKDTNRPIAESNFHQVLIGEMLTELNASYQWARRQLELETSEPPMYPKEYVVRQWRLGKGAICEHAFNVGVLALKACGTRNTNMNGTISRSLRDLTMGLVQAFPAERGKLLAAELTTQAHTTDSFGVGQ